MIDHNRQSQKWITEEFYKVHDVYGFRSVMFVEWGFRPVDPAGYAALLRTIYPRAKQADPNMIVLGGALYDCGHRSHARDSQGTGDNFWRLATNARRAVLSFGRVDNRK